MALAFMPFFLQLAAAPKALKIGSLPDSPFVTPSPSLGVAKSLLSLIGDVSGLSMDFSPNCSAFQAELLTNGSLEALQTALSTGAIDVAIGRLFMNSTLPVDFGPVLYNDELLVASPKPQKLKNYRKLFVVFRPRAWLKILLCFLGICVLFYAFVRLEHARLGVFEVLLQVVRLSLGAGAGFSPAMLSTRIFLGTNLLFWLSLDSIYLGYLSHIFGKASYGVALDSLQKTTDSQKVMVYDWRVERLLLVKYVNRHSPNHAWRLQTVPRAQEDVLVETALGSKTATFLFRSTMEAFPSHSQRMDFVALPNSYLSLYVTFYIRAASGSKALLLFWAREVVEKGFVAKWFKDIARENAQAGVLPEEETEQIILKLAHFEESFQILFGGYFLSALVLGLEVFFNFLDRQGYVAPVEEIIAFCLALLTPPHRHQSPMQNN